MATALAVGVPLGVVAGVVGLWVVVGLATGRAAVEHAPYTRVWSRGGFELRRYHPSIVARVRINEPDLREASSRGFGVIAGYIFGKNSKAGGKENIAMTTPVVALPVHSARPPLVSPEQAATAPVVASTPLLGGDAVDVMFVMPRQYTTVSDLPAPLDPRVRVEAVPERWEAVVTWYGSYATQAGFESRVRRLLASLRAEGLELQLPAPVAGDAGGMGAALGAKSYSYDPPWTPWFVKRNEVAIVVRPPQESAT